MKLVIVQVNDSVDISGLLKGVNVTLNAGGTDYPGVVFAPMDTLDPPAPSIEGDYHISPAE